MIFLNYLATSITYLHELGGEKLSYFVEGRFNQWIQWYAYDNKLEAVVDQNLWIYHAYVGVVKSNNDLWGKWLIRSQAKKFKDKLNELIQ